MSLNDIKLRDEAHIFSYFDGKLSILANEFHGRGVFANEDIQPGTFIIADVAPISI